MNVFIEFQMPLNIFQYNFLWIAQSDVIYHL